MTSKDLAVRFAVGQPEGPRGSVWRLWVRKNDVYIAHRWFADVLKISLHESKRWRHAFTTEYVSKGSPFASTDQDRAVDKWERPPEFVAGVTKAFEIVVPSSEVTTPSHPNANDAFRRSLGGKEVVWVPAAPEGFATHFTVLFTTPEVTAAMLPGWPGRDAMGTRLIWRAELLNTRTVWVVSHELPDTFREFVAEIKRKIQEAERSQMPEQAVSNAPEPRVFVQGRSRQDGTRFYLDISGKPQAD